MEQYRQAPVFHRSHADSISSIHSVLPDNPFVATTEHPQYAPLNISAAASRSPSPAAAAGVVHPRTPNQASTNRAHAAGIRLDALRRIKSGGTNLYFGRRTLFVVMAIVLWILYTAVVVVDVVVKWQSDRAFVLGVSVPGGGGKIVSGASKTMWGTLLGLIIAKLAMAICAVLCVIWYCRSQTVWERDLIRGLEVEGEV